MLSAKFGKPQRCSQVERGCEPESTKPLNTIEHITEPEPTDTDLEFEETRLIARVIVEGHPIKATVDTGASVSFLAERFADTLQTRCPILPHTTDVMLADGSKHRATKAMKCTIRFGYKTRRLMCVVMPGATENIIFGYNFLKEFGALLHCAGHSAWYDPTNTEKLQGVMV